MIEYNFKDKNVVVTGARKGIGRKVADMFAQSGANVVYVSRSIDNNIIAEISKYQGNCMILQSDVSEESKVEELFDQVYSELGSVDILINNASISMKGEITNLDFNDWQKTINNNINSCFLCTKHAALNMISNNYGKIINISSIAGRSKSKIQSCAYTTSKAAIIGFTRHIAEELAKYKINVNAICPSQTKTSMLDRLLTEEQQENFSKRIPIGYIASTEQIANLVLFLSSDESNYMTGSIVDINGGAL